MPRDEVARKRKNLILDILQTENTLSIATLKEKLGAAQSAVSLPTVRNDVTALIREGAPLEYTRRIVTYKPRAKTEFEKRSEVQQPEKAEMAEVACLVIRGHERVRERIMNIVKNKAGWQGFPLKHILDGIWQKSTRIVSLDAGSSTLGIAKKFAVQDFPADHWSHLSVVTNAPNIVDELYKTGSVQTVLIGGELRRERYSIVGHLAERSLEALDIVTDVSFIGATGLDLQRGFTSDNVMEAQMKARLLDLSRVRCVVLDSSKLIRPGGTFSVFVGFSPSKVDFVIMDDGVLKTKDPLFSTFLEKIEDSGICLITLSKLGCSAEKKSLTSKSEKVPKPH